MLQRHRLYLSEAKKIRTPRSKIRNRFQLRFRISDFLRCGEGLAGQRSAVSLLLCLCVSVSLCLCVFVVKILFPGLCGEGPALTGSFTFAQAKNRRVDFPSQQQKKAGEVEPNHQQDQGGQTSKESLVGFETHKSVDEKCEGSRSQDPAQTGNQTPRRNKGPHQTLSRKGTVDDLYTQVEKEKNKIQRLAE